MKDVMKADHEFDDIDRCLWIESKLPYASGIAFGLYAIYYAAQGSFAAAILPAALAVIPTAMCHYYNHFLDY